jgi:hypothetical protein
MPLSPHAEAIVEINRDIATVRAELNKLEREVENLLNRQVILCQLLGQLEDKKRGLMDDGFNPRRWCE